MNLDTYIETAKKAANQFSRQRSFLDKDDVRSEAVLIMYSAFDTYDPEKGRTLKSWIAFLVHRELRKMYSNALTEVSYDPDIMFNSMSNDKTTGNPERQFLFQETVDNLSEAGVEVVKMVFGGELEADGKNNVKREIKHRLRDLGYSWCKIQKAFKELKFFANSFA